MTDTTGHRPMLPAAGWAAIAPALRSRNFRLFWLGQSISLIGTSLQVVAEGWLIYDLTKSTLWLGVVPFVALLPVVPVSLLGGVLIDRLPRRRLIIVTQVGLLAQAALFGLVTISGRLQPWHLILLYFIFGSLLAVDHPARRAFLVDLVERAELANAVALNASSFNVASFIGFATSGLLIAIVGAGGTMLLNSITYLFPIAALASIQVPDVGQDRQRSSLGTALPEGITTLWKQPVILGTISLMVIVGGLAWPVLGMMPAFAESVVGTGSVGLGLLMAASAVGSVIGTVIVTKVGVHQRGRTLAAVSLLLPALVVGFALTNELLLACLLVIGVGLVLLVLQSLTITLVQIHIPDRVRGRVMSVYSMLHAGSDTAGNLIIGATAVYLGLPLALSLGGMVALMYALVLWLALPALRGLE